jgi:hypothetical protein
MSQSSDKKNHPTYRGRNNYQGSFRLALCQNWHSENLVAFLGNLEVVKNDNRRSFRIFQDIIDPACDELILISMNMSIYQRCFEWQDIMLTVIGDRTKTQEPILHSSSVTDMTWQHTNQVDVRL